MKKTSLIGHKINICKSQMLLRDQIQSLVAYYLSKLYMKLKTFNGKEKFVFTDNDADGKENEDCVMELSKK